MYVDVKLTVWQRIQLNEDENVSVKELIELLDKYGPSGLWDDEKERYSPEWENILDTEEYMTVEENDKQSTIELYNNYNELIWENSNEMEN
jgi:hypothetical protein